MFSRTAEYALRVMVFLAARQQANGGSATIRQVAQTTRVPEGYLAKILRSLGRAGLVISQRGLHGGFVIGPDPAQLSVLDIIQSVDPVQRINTCPLGLKSHGAKLCPLHRRMDQALGTIEEAFRKTTIAEVLAEATDSPPLCEVPTSETYPPPMATPAAVPAALTVHRKPARARRERATS